MYILDLILIKTNPHAFLYEKIKNQKKSVESIMTDFKKLVFNSVVDAYFDNTFFDNPFYITEHKKYIDGIRFLLGATTASLFDNNEEVLRVVFQELFRINRNFKEKYDWEKENIVINNYKLISMCWDINGLSVDAIFTFHNEKENSIHKIPLSKIGILLKN